MRRTGFLISAWLTILRLVSGVDLRSVNTVCSRRILLAALCLSLKCNLALYAATYPLPPADVDVIGQSAFAAVREGETLLDLARRHDIGQDEILLANPGISRWSPVAGDLVRIPSLIVLPDAERSGAVLNLAEMRLYHFRKTYPGSLSEIATYPVSIGQVDWRTPLGIHSVVSKRENPSWTPPESIHREVQAQGRSLPKVVPPGPNNPLGEYALSLDRPGYLIHGTNKPLGIGMRVTHGCVRLYPEDIAEFFREAQVGTRVNIVHQPIKLGWFAGQLYLEVHPPLAEFYQTDEQLLESAVQMVLGELNQHPATIQSSLIRQTVKRKNGIPVKLTMDELPWNL